MNFQKNDNLKNIAIIGAGTLGRRIALTFSSKTKVFLYDINEKTLNEGIQFIKENDFFQKQNIKLKGQVIPTTDLKKATSESWLIIEAVPENIKIKKQIFKDLIDLAPKNAIITSNSSSYLIKEFWDDVPEKERYRLLNTHFMMPPNANAVELLGSEKTDTNIINYLYNKFKECYLIPFICQKESTGFIFNRIWAAIKRECCRIIQEGVATPEDVNEIVKINFHLKTGFIQTMDKVGLDVVLDIEKNYVSKNPSLGNEAIDLLEKYVSQNKLGLKTKEGFFKY